MPKQDHPKGSEADSKEIWSSYLLPEQNNRFRSKSSSNAAVSTARKVSIRQITDWSEEQHGRMR